MEIHEFAPDAASYLRQVGNEERKKFVSRIKTFLLSKVESRITGSFSCNDEIVHFARRQDLPSLLKAYGDALHWCVFCEESEVVTDELVRRLVDSLYRCAAPIVTDFEAAVRKKHALKAALAKGDPERDERICRQARELLRNGRMQHELVGILKNSETCEGLSGYQIRRILKKGGVLQSRRKKK